MTHDPEATRAETLRLDKWLWYARFFKTRTLAAKLCRARRVRIDGVVQTKANASVAVGNVLTFPQGRHIRVVRALALGARRGPAAEARGLYEDLAPPSTPSARPAPHARRVRGEGRPTKADRRAIDRLTGEP